MNRIVLPGATIGVLGSGQLGRMLALEARRMGYRLHTLSPGVDTPTGQVADLEVSAEYDDLESGPRPPTFASGCPPTPPWSTCCASTGALRTIPRGRERVANLAVALRRLRRHGRWRHAR